MVKANSFLVDTCVLLWLELLPSRVPKGLIDMLADQDNEVFVSAASVWEIVLKWTAGKLSLPSEPANFVATVRSKSNLGTLALVEAAALQTAKLPLLHKDPFDRLLIAQAIEHGLTLATPDPLIRQYAVRTIWD
jgi:PIN domain nuclease of toxin-antitoxin system